MRSSLFVHNHLSSLMDLAAGVQEAALNAARELWEECHGIGKDSSGIEFSNTRTFNLAHLRVSFVALGRWFMSLAFVLYYDWFSDLGFKSIQVAVDSGGSWMLCWQDSGG